MTFGERRTPLKRTGSLKRTGIKRRSPSSKSFIPYDVRAAVSRRSGGWCEARTPGCPDGWHRAEHKHHVLPRSLGGRHAEENLLDVCSRGHDWIHGHPAESYEHGWLAHSWDMTT